MQAVYRNDNGQLVSVGTVVADPLPAGLSQVTLSAQDEAGLANGSRMWDPATRTVVPNPAWVDPAIAETNRTALESGLGTYIDGAATALANMAAVPTTTDPIQAAAQPTVTSVAQAQTAIRTLQTQLKAVCDVVEQLATTEGNHIRKTVALARVVAGKLDSTANT
jgi:hypothetical protein